MLTKKRLMSLLVVSALCVSTVLTACTPVSGSKYPGTPEANTATINIETEPPQMCSITTNDTISFAVLRHLVDGLVVLDEKDQPVPGVAKDWKISDDQLVYTFNLKKDYKWSNGEPVTANDFAFSIKALLSPDTAADYAYFGYVLKNGEEFANDKCDFKDVGVKVLDDYTLELTLKQPAPYFLGMLTFGSFMPVNEKAYNEIGADKYGTEAANIVTNGAYKMKEWQHEAKIVLVKNTDYPDADKIKIDNLNMVMIKDTNTALNSFKSNEIDMIGLNGDQLAQMNAEGQKTYTYNDGSNFYFEFNLNDPILSNVKVRQALTYAADTESFVKNVVKNTSVPATQFTPNCIMGNKKPFADELGPQFKSHDLEKAKKLLDEAKAELNVSDIEVSVLIDDSDTAAKQAAFFQENWKKDLGIKVNIEVVPFKSRIARMSSKDFQIVMAGWGPDYNDPMTFLEMFETGNGNNHTSYSSKEYDALLEKIRTTIDKDERFGYLMDAEKLLMTDMPIGPFYFRVKDYTLSGKLTGVVRTAFQYFNLMGASITK